MLVAVSAAVIVFVVATIGFGVAAIRSRLRHARAGGFEVALRPAPADPAEAGGWRHVQALATRGRLDVRAIGPGGLWLPPRRLPAIEVLGARHEPGRRTGWRSLWSINPRFHVVVLSTPQGAVEVAVEGRDVERLLARLHGSSKVDPIEPTNGMGGG